MKHFIKFNGKAVSFVYKLTDLIIVKKLDSLTYLNTQQEQWEINFNFIKRGLV
jgi:hypothetical protein